MRDEMKKLQEDMEKLQEDLRRLEIQVAALSTVEIRKTIRDVAADEPPHAATGKWERCKNCKNMRMPHRTNAHYTCELRHATIEPTWTCGLYNDKHNPRTVEPVAHCGN